ncbi:MAG: phosphate acyltransferase PlsX [Rhodobacteraceae bacterium]|nr:phosphate acyltransferase PlsX [Paracoccaceae bacterium]
MSNDTDQPQPNAHIISIDAMGGDRGVPSVVAGVALAAKANPGIRFLIHGDEAEIAPLVRKQRILDKRCDIRHADETVGMEDKPSHVMRHGKKTSMWATIDAVRNGDASVAVSCGNTGALMAVSMIRLRKALGVNRPAIAVLWPSLNPQGFNVVLDVGADIRADEHDLFKYALMGSSYARNGLSIEKPRIGLLNVGTEEHKGRSELREAHAMIGNGARRNGYEFVGFVEGGDIPSDRVDVIVTDGFTGNVALKTGEGTANLIALRMRDAFNHSLFSRLGALFAYTSLKRLGRRIDPRHVNGGVFLGLNGTVIKSHGAADATGVAAAIQLAIKLAELRFTEKLAARVASGTLTSQDMPDEPSEITQRK